MEWIELEELTDDKVSYRYYPEDDKEYGIVSLMRKTGQRIHDKPCPNDEHYISMYVGMAWQRLDKYQKEGNFPKRAMIAWY